jgi:putative tricarboxylic transport membrane protein
LDLRVIFIQLPIAALLLCLGAYVMAAAVQMQYYTPLGPGPGFFPFWLGAMLTVATLVWAGKLYLERATPLDEGVIPDRAARYRLLFVLAALVAYILLLDLFGFRITMLAFLLTVLYGPGRQSLLLSVIIAAVGSFGMYYLFHDLLGLHVPFASIGVLEDLGL